MILRNSGSCDWLAVAAAYPARRVSHESTSAHLYPLLSVIVPAFYENCTAEGTVSGLPRYFPTRYGSSGEPHVRVCAQILFFSHCGPGCIGGCPLRVEETLAQL